MTNVSLILLKFGNYLPLGHLFRMEAAEFRLLEKKCLYLFWRLFDSVCISYAGICGLTRNSKTPSSFCYFLVFFLGLWISSSSVGVVVSPSHARACTSVSVSSTLSNFMPPRSRLRTGQRTVAAGRFGPHRFAYHTVSRQTRKTNSHRLESHEHITYRPIIDPPPTPPPPPPAPSG